MKLALLIFCLNVLFLSDCQKANSTNSTDSQPQPVTNAIESAENMSPKNDQSNRLGDLQYDIKLRLVKKGSHNDIDYQNDVIYIDYTVKNSGVKNYLIFNQGHNNESEKTAVYVEPQPDGSIELSQKAFVQPANKNCPLYDSPILPRALWLKAGQTIKGQVSVSPIALDTPFKDCSPQLDMPKELKTIKFCLGVAEADPKTVKLNGNNFIEGNYDLRQQQLLCSETINIQ